MKKITKAELKKYAGRNSLFLACVNGCGEFSADPNDYLLEEENETLTCCDKPLRLMTKRVVYTEVL